LTLVLSSCATQTAPPVVSQVPAAKLPEVPADVMVQREPNFRARLLLFFSDSRPKLIP